jgi:hypothetical protein
MENLISILECAQACQRCAAACLAEKDIDRLRECIRLDLDCADICLLCATYLSRQSAFEAAICLFCADICEACGSECERHSRFEHCRDCAEACTRCAEACRSMTASMA